MKTTYIFPGVLVVVLDKKKINSKNIPTIDLSTYGSVKEVSKKCYSLFSEECYSLIPEKWIPKLKAHIKTCEIDGVLFSFDKHRILIEEVIWKQSKKRKPLLGTHSSRAALARYVDSMLKHTKGSLTRLMRRLSS